MRKKGGWRDAKDDEPEVVTAAKARKPEVAPAPVAVKKKAATRSKKAEVAPAPVAVTKPAKPCAPAINGLKEIAGTTHEEVELDVHESAREIPIPDDIFPIPGSRVANNIAAEKIFPVIGNARKMFIREGAVTEVVKNKDSDYLSSIIPERFCALVEKFNHSIARLERVKGDDGVYRDVWRKNRTFPMSAAKVIMATDAAKEHLPTIQQMANCPILTPSGEYLAKGYHPHNGGTYISAGKPPLEVPFVQARAALEGILGDFDFASPSDFSRAFAGLISPALKMGGWINDDFPLDMAEADKSQSGKTFRQKMICLIYNEAPSSITMAEGGVGSLDEKISTALLRGRPFITLGNIRGKVSSQIMEDAIRGNKVQHCRGYRKEGWVDCSPFMWQLSTNGAELKVDLANRTIVTKIRKQPDAYEWKTYPEGNLEQHLKKNQQFYLSCVFSILKEWQRCGSETTKENRHDFKTWCRTLDGIVQMCGFSPLLDGHQEQQKRTASPHLQWLREVLLLLPKRDMNAKLSASYLSEISEDNGIDWPGNPFSKAEPCKRVGTIMAKIYRDAEEETVKVDRFNVTREIEIVYEEGRSKDRKKYIVSE